MSSREVKGVKDPCLQPDCSAEASVHWPLCSNAPKHGCDVHRQSCTTAGSAGMCGSIGVQGCFVLGMAAGRRSFGQGACMTCKIACARIIIRQWLALTSVRVRCWTGRQVSLCVQATWVDSGLKWQHDPETGAQFCKWPRLPRLDRLEGEALGGYAAGAYRLCDMVHACVHLLEPQVLG